MTFPTTKKTGLLFGCVALTWAVLLLFPGFGTAQATWTGAAGIDWATPGNWADGSVPTAADDVTIPDVANDPVISTAALARSINVLASGSLTISSTGSLTINSDASPLFTNSGMVVNEGTVSLNTSTAFRFHRLLNQASGTFTNKNALHIGNTSGSNYTVRSIFNRGEFVNMGGAIDISSTNRAIYLESGATFTNNANIVFNTGLNSVDSSAIYVLSGATFNNTPCSATLLATAGSSTLGRFQTVGGTFNNAGLITENSSGSSSISTNTGIVQNLGGGSFFIGNNTGILTTDPAPQNACFTCPDLSAPAPAASVTNSACTSGCTVAGGSISAPAMGCPDGATLQYSTNGGATWSIAVPAYKQTGPAQAILTRCLCDNDDSVSSPWGSVITAPGACIIPATPVFNIDPEACPSTPGVIVATGCGPGTIVEYATAPAGPWSATAPAYTGPALTVYARCRDTNTNCTGDNAMVTVADNTPPVIDCPFPLTHLVLDGFCSASLPDYTSLAQTADNCSVQGVTQSPEAGTTVSGAGPITILLTVTDIAGLTDTCSFTVNKVDNTPPALVCLTNTILLDPTGNYTLLDTDVLDFDASTDNCSAITVTSISPSSFDCDDLMQTFDVLVTAQDDSGNSSQCIASITVLEGTALPQPWAGLGIGGQGTGSTYEYSPCSLPPVYTIETGAANNSQTGDNLATIAQTLCGDFSIEVKIEAVTPNGWAGLTARESAAPGSKMIGMYSNLGSIVRWESRRIAGAPKSINLFSRPFPYWLRLVRQGDLFIGYYSVNGSSYSIVNLQSISLGSCLEVGVAAFTSIPGQTATAVFSNLAASGGAIPLSIAPGTTIEPAQAERAARLWPNPARGAFTLELPAATAETRLRLLNQLGQPLEERLLPAGESQLEWGIGQLPAGLYFVELFPAAGQSSTVLRLVKTD